jgi:ABC-2 type transport system permease protein
MRKYFKVYMAVFRFNLKAELQHKVHFFLMVPVHLAWVAKEVLVVLFIYSKVNSIGGWTQAEAIVLLGTVYLLDGVLSALVLNNVYGELPAAIQSGSLDGLLLRPISARFSVMTKSVSFHMLQGLIAGAILVAYGLAQVGIALPAVNWLSYALLVTVSVALLINFNSMIAAFAFWTKRADYLGQVGLLSTEFMKRPLGIYPRVLRIVLLTFLPMGLVGFTPANSLLHGPTLGQVLLALSVTVVFGIAARLTWSLGLRRYNGASA